MQREIIFKAKRIDNGEWMFSNGITMLDNDEETCLLSNNGWVAVNPDTICQYTGINTDGIRNPVKVFEGDIIHIDEKGVKYYVMPLGTFHQNDMAIQGYYVSDGSNILDWQVGLEIIGNIHD